MDNSPTSEVLAMNEITFKGNVIPHSWYKHLRYESGKANLNAIIILSEIAYWYRPSEVRDEETGQLLGYKKKFRADKLLIPLFCLKMTMTQITDHRPLSL